MKAIMLRPTDDGCAREVDALRGSYVNTTTAAAVLHLQPFAAYAIYEQFLRQRKGVWSDITRSRRLGFRVHEYAHRKYLRDVVAIDRSKEIRSGGPMRPSYKRSLEERGGEDPNATILVPRCLKHWRQTWGVFYDVPEKLPQGADAATLAGDDGSMAPTSSGLTEREMLVAYCSLIRSDELALYSMWLGHGLYLPHGIMHLLHAEVVRHLMEAEVARGVLYVMYGPWHAADKSGLNDWKRRVGFEPTKIMAPALAVR